MFVIEYLSRQARRHKRIWRSRLVGRGRTTGNRVTGKTVREFESLHLRQKKHTFFQMCAFFSIKFAGIQNMEEIPQKLKGDQRNETNRQRGMLSQNRKTQPQKRRMLVHQTSGWGYHVRLYEVLRR